MLQPLTVSLSILALSITAGCSGADASGPSDGNDSEGALHHGDSTETVDLAAYGMAFGMVALDDNAHELRDAIKAHGGTDMDHHIMFAGLTGADLGMSGEDKSTTFGLTCQSKSGDIVLDKDKCSLSAVVKMSDAQKMGSGSYVITLKGKVAAAIAHALPRTNAEGLVGASQTAAGNVKCKTIPGPAGSTCTIPLAGNVSTFKELVEQEMMTADEAKKTIKLFDF